MSQDEAKSLADQIKVEDNRATNACDELYTNQSHEEQLEQALIKLNLSLKRNKAVSLSLSNKFDGEREKIKQFQDEFPTKYKDLQPATDDWATARHLFYGFTTVLGIATVIYKLYRMHSSDAADDWEYRPKPPVVDKPSDADSDSNSSHESDDYESSSHSGSGSDEYYDSSHSGSGSYDTGDDSLPSDGSLHSHDSNGDSYCEEEPVNEEEKIYFDEEGPLYEHPKDGIAFDDEFNIYKRCDDLSKPKWEKVERNEVHSSRELSDDLMGRIKERNSMWRRNLGTTMEYIAIAAGVVTGGLALYQHFTDDHWEKACEQLKKEKETRGTEYGDVKKAYMKRVEILKALTFIFTTYFEKQCSSDLKTKVRTSTCNWETVGDKDKDSNYVGLPKCYEGLYQSANHIIEYVNDLVTIYTQTVNIVHIPSDLVKLKSDLGKLNECKAVKEIFKKYGNGIDAQMEHAFLLRILEINLKSRKMNEDKNDETNNGVFELLDKKTIETKDDECMKQITTLKEVCGLSIDTSNPALRQFVQNLRIDYLLCTANINQQKNPKKDKNNCYAIDDIRELYK